MASETEYRTKTGARRYQARWRAPDGQQRSKAGFTTLAAAKAYGVEKETSKAQGTYTNPKQSKILFGTLGEAWLKSRPDLRPSTLTAYNSAWSRHIKPRWGKTPVGNIRHTDVQTWLGELTSGAAKTAKGVPKGPVTVRRCHDVMLSILDAAVLDHIIPINHARKVKRPPKITRERVFLDHDQVARLVAAAGDHGPLVDFLAYSGLRWGEAAALTVSDVDFPRSRIRVNKTASLNGGQVEVGPTKTGSHREVVLPDFIIASLKTICKNRIGNALVFPDRNGGYQKTPTVSANSWWDRAKKKANMPPALRIHDLRHTAACLAIRAGASVKTVQAMLGHASAVETLNTYAHMWPDDLDTLADQLAEARRLMAHDQSSPVK